MSLFGRGAPPPQHQPLPFPPGSPEGLAARWVRWAASTRLGQNPVADTTGEFAGNGQPDDVWFLAGTFGGHTEPVQRRCAVPAGRPVFMPAFNVWMTRPRGVVVDLSTAFGAVAVDGVKCELDVIATPPFEVAGARGNPVTRRRRPVEVAVWGLWRLLGPLSVGPHVIDIIGGDGGDFRTSVTYRVTVQP
ncbi:hypothetical protein [Parafrankia sp. EUN1f]|uniref:hypothetical protein n=1 Tax=Parafrankia sp. EUN1f TaxID=102897 RepID=UPI0001C43AF8|nr:hypothetical protein [Parafrankia sp. EUN1f]EFC82575.1 hypothetical protein FrEUN1fDRAFT_4298 [Parafrankia sp. EUN1f]